MVGLIKQIEDNDCGICSLSSIAHYYKRFFNLYELKVIAGVGNKSLSLKDLRSLANLIGFNAVSVYSNLHSLYKIDYPVIALISKFENSLHYVVIVKVLKNYIHLMDPSEGKIVKLEIRK